MEKNKLEEIKRQIKADLQYCGLLDKYEVHIKSQCENNILKFDEILVETEYDDTLKDIEETIIEFVKQNYNDNIFWVCIHQIYEVED